MLNPLEEGDACIVCVNGLFSERMAVIAERVPAKVIRVEAPLAARWIRRTFAAPEREKNQVCRAGAWRNFQRRGAAAGELPQVADELGALLIVDTVATLAGIPLDVDREGIDICFSGSQKAISAPPGMAPITVNTRVEDLMRARKTPVRAGISILRRS